MVERNKLHMQFITFLPRLNFAKQNLLRGILKWGVMCWAGSSLPA